MNDLNVAMNASSKRVDLKGLLNASIAGSLSWSTENNAPVSQIIAATVGLAGPLAVGAWTGRMGIGMIGAMGGLALSSAGGGQTRRDQFSSLGYTLLSGSAAMLAGASLAGRGMVTLFLFPLLAGAIALIGSISRPLARATTHFILYCIIAMHFDIEGLSPITLTLIFLMGAGWYALIAFTLTNLLHTLRTQTSGGQNLPPKYPAKLLFRRWTKRLGGLSGWQYALRLTICFMAAESFEWVWPHHHGYWVLITIVIVLQRDIQKMPAKIFQRSAGTLAGVLIAGLLLIGPLPVWATIAAVGFLSAGCVVLKEANYTAYAAVMTLLIVFLLDFGTAPDVMIFLDRFVATLAGCMSALLLGYLPWHISLSRTAIQVDR